MLEIINADVRVGLAQLADESVHMICCSPPYFGLRRYLGVPPTVWGGDPTCSHVWGQSSELSKVSHNGVDKSTLHGRNPKLLDLNQQYHDTITMAEGGNLETGQRCQKCGAFFGTLGNEDSPEQYVANLVEVFHEARRVLRSTGCAWLNVGDSYCTGTSAPRKASKGGQINHGYWTNDNITERVNVVGIPAKNALLIPDRLRVALQDDGWIVRVRSIPWIKRCLSGGTTLYVKSQKGTMPMTVREMVRLDPSTVQLWNGAKWTQVLGFSRREPLDPLVREMVQRQTSYARKQGKEPGNGDYVEIELRSGEKIGCTGDHRWPTDRGLLRTDELKLGDVLQQVRLPEPEDLHCPAALDDESTGWFVGLYIAEGFRDDYCIHFAGHEKEIERLEKLRGIAAAFDGTHHLQIREGHSVNINVSGPVLNGIIDRYVAGRLAKGKHLTTSAWQRSDVFLQGVLDGYLSGDGSWDAPNNRWRLGFTDNRLWARDLRTICARLGVGLRLRPAFGQFKEDKAIPMYRGEVRVGRLDLPRKSSTGFRPKPDTEIVGLGRNNANHYWDIEVADEPHLFALASGVLSHNSCMPQSVTDRPTVATEDWMMLTKSARYFWDSDAVRRKMVRGSAGSTFTKGKTAEAKPGVSLLPRIDNTSGRNWRTSDAYFDSLDLLIEEQEDYVDHLRQVRQNGGMLLDPDGDPLALDIVSSGSDRRHYAAYPEKLVEPLILGGTSEYGCCSLCGAPWTRIVSRESAPASVFTNRAAPTDGLVYSGSVVDGTWHGQGQKLQDWRNAHPSTTVGWRPTCACGAPEGWRLDDAEVIETPTGERVGEDPSLEVGRAGYSRPRGDAEGKRSMTRYEQRMYAAQMNRSWHLPEMTEEAGPAYAHYIRSDRSGARPLPPELLLAWVERGWLTEVVVPTWTPPPPIPATVLDPFLGSGTTLSVAKRLGRSGVGIEASKAYVDMSQERLDSIKFAPPAVA